MTTNYAALAFHQMRHHLGFSQRQLADHIGVNHTFISRTESGETEPVVSRFFTAIYAANFHLVDPDKAQVAPNPKVQYLSMMYSFNTRPKTFAKTSGDWHRLHYFQDPDKINYIQIGHNPFGAWGIDNNVSLPAIDGKKRKAKVANHIRAFLDLLYYQQFTLAKEALEDFIGTDEYDSIIFQKVSLLKKNPHLWLKTDDLMNQYFTTKWRKYKRTYKLTKKEA